MCRQAANLSGDNMSNKKTIAVVAKNEPILVSPSIRTTFNKNMSTKESYDLYMLPDNDGTQEPENSGMHMRKKTQHASKCMCAACDKIMDIDATIVNRFGYAIENQESVPESCPDCGKEFKKIQNMRIEQNENGETLWTTGYMMTKRSLRIEEADDGKIEKIEDIYVSEKKYVTEQNEISVKRKYNVRTHNINACKNTETIIETDGNNNKISEKIKNLFDPFKDRHTEPHRNERHERQIFQNAPKDIKEQETENLQERYVRSGDWQQTLAEDKTRYQFGSENELITDIKARLIEQRFHSKYNIPISGCDNRLYEARMISEKNMREQNMTEQNNTDSMKKDMYLQMMILYPAAFEYAIERADKRVEEYMFEQKRKKQKNPDHQIKDVTEKGKALFLREEVKYVYDQLMTVDNKILDVIHKAKDKDDMKQQLEAIASGQVRTDMSNVQINIEQARSQPVQFTKFIKNKMQQNPIGVANTIYTCHKIGLKDTDTIKKIIDLSEKRSKIKKRTRKPNLGFVPEPPTPDTIPPIKTREEMSFMRNLSKTHTPDIFVNEKNGIYGDEARYDLLEECIGMYTHLMKSGVKLKDNADDIVREDIHDQHKRNIKAYLKTHSTTDAYIDFCETFGKQTPQIINSYIEEIKFDSEIENEKDKIKTEIEKDGLHTVAEKYQTDKIPSDYAEKCIQKIVLGEEQKSKEAYVTTRNGKPLFNNRTLDEIHEELSVINRHTVNDNIDLDQYYPEKIKNMQQTYPCPDSAGEWSFHVHENSFDVIESSRQLHNCLGNSHIENITYGYAFVMYMQNEDGQRVAAIELKRSSKDDHEYKVTQFQGDHDNALDERYAAVALQWLEDNDIDYSDCRDVQLFGTGQSIYGGRDADYHSTEVDKVTNTLVGKGEVDKLNKRRVERAKQLYSYSEESGYDFGVDEIPSI